jgi:uncharacterized membrane protein YdjX (TVP38/TMEM64 family)
LKVPENDIGYTGERVTTNHTNTEKSSRTFILIGLICTGLVLGVLIYANRVMLWEYTLRYYDFLTNRQRTAEFIRSFGYSAPVIFIMLQVSQVLVAPIPGEVTGFLGGYIFGTFPGFIYSSIGLSLGSWLNILIGRLLGRRVVRKLISPERLNRFDRILKRQGIIVFFLLFVFPGFPKDYLCFFLGVSNAPLRVLVFIASVGRLPATFLLSLQGAYLYKGYYSSLIATLLVCLAIGFFCYRYKQKIYGWVERYNGISK